MLPSLWTAKPAGPDPVPQPASIAQIWLFPLFGGPCNKDPNILGSVIGPLIFGNSHMGARVWVNVACFRADFSIRLGWQTGDSKHLVSVILSSWGTDLSVGFVFVSDVDLSCGNGASCNQLSLSLFSLIWPGIVSIQYKISCRGHVLVAIEVSVVSLCPVWDFESTRDMSAAAHVSPAPALSWGWT